MGIFRSAITDEHGQVDVAYLSLFFTMAALFGAIVLMSVVHAISFFRCTPVVTATAAIVTCQYDPQPLGIAIGAACTGFGVALGALAGYMAATRKPAPATTTTTVNATQTTTAPPTGGITS